MKEELKSHILRTMLLEGDEHAKILASVKKYQKATSPEAKAEIVDTIRKHIVEHAKQLMTDDQINTFIGEVPKLD